MIQVEFNPGRPAAAKYVQLEVLRPMFANGQPIKVGEVFTADTRVAGEILATGRCRIAPGQDRSLVLKEVEVW